MATDSIVSMFVLISCLYDVVLVCISDNFGSMLMRLGLFTKSWVIVLIHVFGHGNSHWNSVFSYAE